MVEVVERRDIFGCLRHLAVNDFHEAMEQGCLAGRNEPRTQPVLVLARALRQLLANADLDSSMLRSNCQYILRQVRRPCDCAMPRPCRYLLHVFPR